MRCNLNLFTIPLMLLIGLQLSWAQNGRDRAVKELKKLKDAELLVVLDDDDDAYNEAMKAAVTKYWTFTPFTFIERADLRDYASEDGYAMLVRNNSKRIIKRVGRTDHIQSNHLAIYVCGKGDDLRNYTGQDAVTQFRLKDVMDTEAYEYKLTALVQHMHQYLVFLDENNITEDNHEKQLKLFNTKDVAKLAEMKLYILAEQLPAKLNDPEKLRKSYDYDVEIVGKEQIQAAIATQREEIAFLHLDPRVKTIYVMGAQGGKILYQASTQESGTLKGKDFSQLSRAISSR